MSAPASCSRRLPLTDWALTKLGSTNRIDLAGLAAGQVFARRFQLVRKLGEGGMGQSLVGRTDFSSAAPSRFEADQGRDVRRGGGATLPIGTAVAGDYGSQMENTWPYPQSLAVF
jgi:hypothetical protein